MIARRRRTGRLAHAFAAASLLPGLFLGRSGVLPCPHMAADMDAGMMGAMGAMGAMGTMGTMGMPPGGIQGGEVAMDHDAMASGDHHALPRHDDSSHGPPLGHVPCNCPEGCPGASPAEAPPVATFAFTVPQAVASFEGLPTPAVHAPAPVRHLLPFALGPPLSA